MEKRLHTELVQKSIQTVLSTGLKVEAEYLSDHCCSKCNKMNRVRIAMEKVSIKNPPVPVKGCVREGGCNCTLLFIPID